MSIVLWIRPFSPRRWTPDIYQRQSPNKNLEKLIPTKTTSILVGYNPTYLVGGFNPLEKY
jgi:hypothetical protein